MKTKEALAVSENPKAYSLTNRRLAWLILSNKALRAFASSPRQKTLIEAYQKIGTVIPK
jgi:hypothetical protein